MKLNVDIAHDFFDDAGVAVTHEGQDVTAAFENDIPQPMKATVEVVNGPGGGNPCILLEFLDEDHAWEWFSNSYMPDEFAADEFEHHIAA